MLAQAKALAVEKKQSPTRELSTSSGPSHEQIRRRAYERYCARNGAPGDALQDWLEAERELRQSSRTGRHADLGQRELALLSASESAVNGDVVC